MKILERTQEHQTWFELSKLVFVRILLFNRKRTGELGKMLIDDLNNVKKGDQMNEHVLKCFTESEKQMAYQMNLIEIEGKRGTVPVLLTSEMIDLMQFILKFRIKNKINPENVHFFP
uniref:Uncharacterized protein n=1 Tax=Cacopsylla melanoneura TaxID=428564 RepID=A0A8D9EA34_9HEMI